MITLNMTVGADGMETTVELPDSQPPLDIMIKAMMVCQFDLNATNYVTEQVRLKYGEEYYNKTVHAMAEVVKSFREIIQNSIAVDPETPAVSIVYMSPRGSK